MTKAREPQKEGETKISFFGFTIIKGEK